MRVLIVDDQPVFRRAARDLLEARGYTVVGEADGLAAALEALDRCAPDAVLLDVHLGAECGFAAAHALVRARPGLSVVLVSADELEDPARVGTCGARGFVLKPCLSHVDLDALWG